LAPDDGTQAGEPDIAGGQLAAQFVDHCGPSRAQGRGGRQIGGFFHQLSTLRGQLIEFRLVALERGRLAGGLFVQRGDPLGRPVVVEAANTQGGDQSGGGGGEEGAAALIGFGPLEGRGLEPDFQRTIPQQQMQGGTGAFPEGVRLGGQAGGIDAGTDADAPQRVEKLDRKGQLLVEELQRVGQRHAAAGEVNAHGRGAVLARAVKSDGARDFVVHACHNGPRDLGRLGGFGILGARVVARGRNDRLGALVFFDLHEAAALELFLQGRADRVATHREGPDEELVSLDKDEVGGPGADVDQQRATLGFRVIETEGVVERDGGGFDEGRAQSGAGKGVDRGLELIPFGRQDDGAHRFAVAVGEDLIAPGNFFDRVGHVLLGLEVQDAGDLSGIDARNPDKARENALRRYGASDRTVFPTDGRLKFGQGDLQLSRTTAVCRRIGQQTVAGVSGKGQSVGPGALEDGQGNRLHAKIDGGDAGGCAHGETGREGRGGRVTFRRGAL
jgi:hypothetical protein